LNSFTNLLLKTGLLPQGTPYLLLKPQKALVKFAINRFRL